MSPLDAQGWARPGWRVVWYLVVAALGLTWLGGAQALESWYRERVKVTPAGWYCVTPGDSEVDDGEAEEK